MPITMEETRKICEKVRQGSWVYVELHLVSAVTGKSELLTDDPAFGRNEETKERGWLLTSEDYGPIGRGVPEEAPIIQALSQRVDDWRPIGEVATIRVRFFSEDWKKQTEVSVAVCGMSRGSDRLDVVQTKAMIAQAQVMGEVSIKALEQAGKDGREVQASYRHQIAQQSATISQQQTIMAFQQNQIASMSAEAVELRKELREAQKTIRELEAGGGWQSVILKALDPANAAAQGGMVAVLAAAFAAMGAKTFPEALAMAGKIGGQSLQDMMKQMLAPVEQIEERPKPQDSGIQPETAP